MVGKDIDTLSLLFVPANKRVRIRTKSIVDRRFMLLEEITMETKICTCVKDTTQNVSELNKQLLRIINQLVKVSAQSFLLESGKEMVSIDLCDNRSDSDEEDNDLVYDIDWEKDTVCVSCF